MENTSELTQLLVSLSKLLELGNPIGHRNLTLVPLFGQAPTAEYLLGQEAIQDGLLARRQDDRTYRGQRPCNAVQCGVYEDQCDSGWNHE